MNPASDFMIRLKKFAGKLAGARLPAWLHGRIYAGRIYASLLMFMVPVWLIGQNIFDEAHSRRFAQYLMQTHQFQLASAEWERILFLSPGDTAARLNQLKSLRFSQKSNEGWQKLTIWYPSGNISRSFAMEGILLTLGQEDYTSFQSVLDRSTGLTPSEKSNYQLGSWLLEGKWIREPAKTRVSPFAGSATDVRLLDLYSRTKNIHRVSPAASVALSAIVPGLGKVYAHDWKDGLLSLLFVATNAWQSYRGFAKSGTSSVTGWVFGSLAVGFYSANLFGSWKSAHSYNSKQSDLIRHETEGVLFTR